MRKILSLLFIFLSFASFSYEKDSVLSHLDDPTGKDYLVKVYQEKTDEGGYLFKMDIANTESSVTFDLTPDEYMKFKDITKAKISEKYLAPHVYTDFEVFVLVTIVVLVIFAILLLIIYHPEVIVQVLGHI